jgi:hypothetical protein
MKSIYCFRLPLLGACALAALVLTAQAPSEPTMSFEE